MKERPWPNRSIPSQAARACEAGRITSQPAGLLLAYDPGLQMGRDVDEVIAAIEQRIAAAQAEIASLEVPRSVLAGVGALAGKAPRCRQPEIGGAARPRTRSASRRRKPARPSRADVAELKRLLAEADGGLSGSALAELAGAPPATVRAQLRELERSGEVRSAGERRGRRWTLVTDEDRIAQRVAELERSRATTSPPKQT